jgi:hypothetical protein
VWCLRPWFLFREEFYHFHEDLEPSGLGQLAPGEHGLCSITHRDGDHAGHHDDSPAVTVATSVTRRAHTVGGAPGRRRCRNLRWQERV